LADQGGRVIVPQLTLFSLLINHIAELFFVEAAQQPLQPHVVALIAQQPQRESVGR